MTPLLAFYLGSHPDHRRRMLRFYGLEARGPRIAKGRNWTARKSDWFTGPTHNSLRITRILKSLMLGGSGGGSARLSGCARIAVRVGNGLWGAGGFPAILARGGRGRRRGLRRSR